MERRRRRLRFVKWIVVVGLLAGLGMAAYETGSVLAQREVARLGDEVASLQRQVEVLRRQNAHLATDAGAARLRERDLRLRYEADVPDGAAKALLDRIRARLADGVSAERLDFMISSATGAPACDGQPVTKRFMVRTPLTRGANDAAGFADRTISVSATGASATSEGGAPEAWFDPGKPVVLSFVGLGGKTVTVDGLLPLHKSLLHNGSEYRFTAAIGERRGFIDITADRCDFPGGN
jgi:hypothetical protein